MDEKRGFAIKDALEDKKTAPLQQEKCTEQEAGQEQPQMTEADEPVSARDAWHAKQQKAAGAAGYAAAGTQTLQNGQVYYGSKPPKPKNGRNKALLIFGCILLGVLLLAILVKCGSDGEDDVYRSGADDIEEDYIGVLHIEGEITEDGDTYNQAYILDALDGMINNDSNRAMLLYVNTPGGGVYESDEVYLKIKEYQQKTHRPVYAYMASQATSGGYYISAPADKIVANRNCWTGSIGVTIGTLFDASELLEKYGIKTNTITSGEHKDMGSAVKTLTKEEKQIWQELIDESYEQFIDVVAEGRGLSTVEVRRLADGRIYSAKQAKENKLIDEVIDTYEAAQDKMQSELHLEDCEFYDFAYEPADDLLSNFVESAEKLLSAKDKQGELAALTGILERQNEDVKLQYMCEIVK